VIKVIALGLAVGIAIDAFLVRMTLVPALMALFGKHAWYLPKWLDRILPNVDIEGESLRAHLEDLAWAQTRVEAGEAVTLDALVAGDRDDTASPATAAVPAGALAVVAGDPTRRRLLAATVAGRLPARAGRAQVAGHPLPSDESRVARLVSIAEFGGPERAGVEGTLGELLEERLRLTGAWYRAFQARRRARAWIARVQGVLSSLDRPTAEVTAETPIAALPQLERAVAGAALALSERTPVVVLDTLDPFADPADAADFLRALDRLAPATTTVLVGTPDAHHVRPELSRPLLAFEPEGALR
jgi:RND superfamily putative drug exporter